MTVAGGHGQGDGLSQLSDRSGLRLDYEDTVIVAEFGNHRIIEWKQEAMAGTVLAGGNGRGNRPDQLHFPLDVIVGKVTDSFIICDYRNRRVTRWSRLSGTRSGETIINNIYCRGLTMDDEESRYVTDWLNHEVRRYWKGETNGTVVAGGNEKGVGLDQLNGSYYVYVDGEHAVYVADREKHRLMK